MKDQNAIETVLGLAASSTQLKRMTLAFGSFHMAELIAGMLLPKQLIKTRKQQFLWTDAFVGLGHHFAICYLAHDVITKPDKSIEDDKMYGKSDRVSLLFSISTAYFAWDLSTCARQGINDPGVLLHAGVCGLCYLFGQFPYLHWYGVRFLLFELSSIFLQLRSVLKLLKMEGLVFKLLQAGFAVSFFVVRILYGMPLSFQFWKDSLRLLKVLPPRKESKQNDEKKERLVEVKKPHSIGVVVFYFVANIIVNILNVTWMTMILKKLALQLKQAKVVKA